MSAERALALAWYTPEQFAAIKAVSEDAVDMQPGFASWRATAEEYAERMEREGVRVVKIPMDVDKLTVFCRERGLNINGESRAAFANHCLGILLEKGLVN